MRAQTALFWVLWTHNESVKLWIKHYPAMAKVLPSPHRKRDPVDRIAALLGAGASPRSADLAGETVLAAARALAYDDAGRAILAAVEAAAVEAAAAPGAPGAGADAAR